MKWKIYDEMVQLEQQRFRFLPCLFRWRGRRFRAEGVDRTWTRPRQMRRYYRVRCAEGTFEMYQDLIAGTWHLRRARLDPSQQATARFLPVWR